MTKTEAAEIMANDVIVWARKTGTEISKDLAEARVSEYRGSNYASTVKGQAATIASPVTVLRIARREARANAA